MAIGALLLSACSFNDGPSQFEQQYSFPNAPQIVHLWSFGSQLDISPPSGFERFVIGEDAFDAAQNVFRPFGIAATKGKVYINDGRGKSGYWIYDLDTKQLRLVSNRALDGSLGIAIDDRGYKYLTVPRIRQAKAEHTAGTEGETGRIVVFNAQDQLVKMIEFPGRPVDIEVTHDRLFVTDITNHRVVVLDKTTGAVVGDFGKRGAGDNEFNYPKGIVVAGEQIYVGDLFNGQIKVFDRVGELVGHYGYRSALLGGFQNIGGLAVDKEGIVYVVDTGYSRKFERDEVQIFDSRLFYPGNEQIPPITTPLTERRNSLLGYFSKPFGIAETQEGSEAVGAHSVYTPQSVTVDYENTQYFDHLVPENLTLRYLIWMTSQHAAGGKNVTVFGYVTEKSGQ